MQPSPQLLRHVLRSQWGVLAVYMVVGIGIVAASNALSVRWYRAHSVIQLLAEAGQEIEGEAVRRLDGGGFMEGRDRARTQLQIIQSHAVFEEVIRRYQRLGHTELTADGRGVAALAEVVSVGPREDTQLVEVRVEHTDPAKAAVLADLVAEVYLSQNIAFRRNAAEQSKDWLVVRHAEATKQLRDATQRLQDYDRRHSIITGATDDTATRLTALQRALGKAETQRVEVGSALAEHERLLSSGRPDVLTSMFDDVALNEIAQSLAAAQADAAEARARYGERHPIYRQANSVLEEVRQLVSLEVGRLVRAERSQYKALKRQEAHVREEMDAVKAGLMDVQRRDKQREELVQAEVAAQALVSQLSERSRSVALQAQTQLSDVRVVEHAAIPGKPVRPDSKLQLALAFIVSLVGGLALATARYLQHDSVQTADDVEQRTGVNVLAALPTLTAGSTAIARALYPARNPHSLHAEAHRSLRTMVQARLPQRPARLLVTSGVAEEGKTNTICGLAASYARLGLRILVVDADLRRPRLHTLFQRGQCPGLADLLRSGGDPLDHIVDTTIEGVSLLPAGEGTEDGAVLLGSLALTALFNDVSQHYDVVLVDCSPVGLVADALAVARCVDAALLVVRRDKAPARLAQAAADKLRGCGVRILGTVLNDVPLSRDAITFGKGYYSTGRQKRRGA